MSMVHCTSCGPSTPANTPPAITHDTALGRNAALAPSAAAKAIGLRHRTIEPAEEGRAAEQPEGRVQNREGAEQAGERAERGADHEGDLAAIGARDRAGRQGAGRHAQHIERERHGRERDAGRQRRADDRAGRENHRPVGAGQRLRSGEPQHIARARVHRWLSHRWPSHRSSAFPPEAHGARHDFAPLLMRRDAPINCRQRARAMRAAHIGQAVRIARAIRSGSGFVATANREPSRMDDRPTLAAPDDDPYLWLEEIEGARALDFVAAQNRRTLDRFGGAQFAADRDMLEAIYDRPDNIPYVDAPRPARSTISGRMPPIRAACGGEPRSTPSARRSPTGRPCSTSTSSPRTKAPTGC